MKGCVLAAFVWICFFVNVNVGVAYAPQGIHGDAARAAMPYVKHAEKFWSKRGGFVNCPGGVEVSWFDWGGYGAAWADLGGCHIYLDPYDWVRTDNVGRCHYLLHEWGHLIGLGHSENRYHIMYGGQGYQLHSSCYKFQKWTTIYMKG